MSKLDDFFSELDEEGYRGECWILSREELDDRRRRLVEALGFTREHVLRLRVAATNCQAAYRRDVDLMRPERARESNAAYEFYTDLAGRIEALLSPEGERPR